MHSLLPTNMATVRSELDLNPKGNCSHNNTPLSKSSFNRDVSQDIKYYPYHVLTGITFKDGDHAKRLTFCNWLIAKPAYFVPNIVIGDEAIFYMNTVMYAEKKTEPHSPFLMCQMTVER